MASREKKSRFLAVLLAQIPGLGHVYLGQYSRGAKMFLLAILVLVIQVFVIYPLIIFPIDTKLQPSLIENIVMFVLYLPLLATWGFNAVDAFHQTDKVNKKRF